MTDNNFKLNDLREETVISGMTSIVHPVYQAPQETANCDECDCEDSCEGCDIEGMVDFRLPEQFDPEKYQSGAEAASYYAGFIFQMLEVGLSPEQAIEFLKHKMTIDEEMELTRLNNVVALRIAERNWKDEKKGVI
jgi:hypothetical protein